MEYITTQQAAEKWGISQRRVALLCAQEVDGQPRVKGVLKRGKTWLIPKDAFKPDDDRIINPEILLDGDVVINGKFYKKMRERYDYDIEAERCIINTCKHCIESSTTTDEEKRNRPVMMLGAVQSGKTRTYTGLIALAFDNDFDIAFILTKSSKALVRQTHIRMKEAFSGIKDEYDNNEVDVKNIMKLDINLSSYELRNKMIVILKKETNNLDMIAKFIKANSIDQEKNCIVIDDEADSTGIGWEKIKDVDAYFLRTIASKVNEMRGSLEKNCAFVQVTATPYALYLQPSTLTNGNGIKPIKPGLTALVPWGNEYCGGEYYFLKSKDSNHPARFLFEEIGIVEHEIVSDVKRKGKVSMLSDGRTMSKDVDVLDERFKLPIFKKSIINFIVGGIVLQKERKRAYAFAIHTATAKNTHEKLKSNANEFLLRIQKRKQSDEAKIDYLIEESYKDIKASYEACGKTMPSLEYVKENFYYEIDSGHCSVFVVNSDSDIDNLLDEDTGLLKLRSPFSIFIGGQVLDRGVTIPNMIGFYYGRSPQAIQQDTVLQHCRMFGYRKNELPVTRFYTSLNIYTCMEKIIENDIDLREQVKLNPDAEFMPVKCAQPKDKSGLIKRIVPCSLSKTKISDLQVIVPHKRLLPIGFTPVGKAESNALDAFMDKILVGAVDEGRAFVLEIRTEDAVEIIKQVYSTIKADDDAPRFLEQAEFIDLMAYLLKDKSSIKVVIKRGKENNKFRESGRIEDSPAQGETELPLARELAVDAPVIILLRQNGQTADWKYRQFWWPILIAPKNVDNTIYASREEGENIVNRS